MPSRTVRFLHEHVPVEEPCTEERTPWPHDPPYSSNDGRRNCSLWIPLEGVEQFPIISQAR